MTAKAINPAHIDLPGLPDKRHYSHFHYADDPDEIREHFAAKHGAPPDVVMLVNLSTTERPNAVWIAGPVDIAANMV